MEGRDLHHQDLSSHGPATKPTKQLLHDSACLLMQEAVGKLDGELSDMAVHIGLLQHHMHSLQAPPATHSPVGIAA